MRKTLKSQGTIEQWAVLIRLSLEQMKLDTEIQGNTIYALHKGLQVMKFDISENNGIIVDIDYFDSQDLEDFRRFAAQIIKNPNAYRNPPETDQTAPINDTDANTEAPDAAAAEPVSDNTESDEGFYDPGEPDADTNSAVDDPGEPDADTDSAFYDSGEPETKTNNVFDDLDESALKADQISQNNINDLIQPAQAESSSEVPAVKPDQKKKTWPVVLITLGVLIVLAAVGFLGYRFYQQKQIPNNLLSQAVAEYNAGDYENAVATATKIITNYPNSDLVNTAQTLVDNAQAALDKQIYEAQIAARKQAAQSMFAITYQSMTGPDEDGDVHLFFGYTNNYTANLVSVSFGVNFVNAENVPVLIEGADSETVVCTDEQGLAAGTALSADLIQDFGPYRNDTITGFNLVSVEVTYDDGTVLTLGSMDEASWVLVL